MKEQITISKDKLVLLSKLLKDTKNLYKDVEGKELVAYKYKTQRRMIETLFDEEAIDGYIDKLKDKLYKDTIRKQAGEKIGNDEENEVISDSL